MSYENVRLWFAKDSNEKIVTIDEVNESNIHNTYLCPVCGSDLLPKATKSKRITPHFAHVDASKCNSESQIHFWFKHKFLEKGDKFTVVSDEERNYIVKDILVEESYETENGIYKPDVTISTECGKTIYFEMAFTNKKKVKDYLDIWLELKNIVVEVDIKQLMLKDSIPTFKALFYNGKCFNTKRNDTYYNTIGKYKEEKLKGNVNDELKERIRKLDWFWDDIFRYKNGDVGISEIVNLIDIINKQDTSVILDILKKQKCLDIFDKFIENKSKYIFNSLSSFIIHIPEKDSFKITIKDIVKYKRKISSVITFQYVGKEYVFFDYEEFDILEHSLDYIKNAIQNIIKNVNKDRLIQKENNRIKENIQVIINELNSKYKKISNYFDIKLISSEGGTINIMWLHVYLTYNYRYVLDFSLDDELILTKDLVRIENFVSNKINEYIEQHYPHNNEKEIYKILQNFKKKYTNYLLRKEKFLEMGYMRAKTKINSTRLNFDYDFYHPNLICIDIGINKYYGAGGLTTITSKYFCFHNNILYQYENLNDRKSIENGSVVKIFNIEDECVEFENILNDFLLVIILEYVKSLNCEDCDKKLNIKEKDIIFFIDKEFELPKRCKSCRNKRKGN